MLLIYSNTLAIDSKNTFKLQNSSSKVELILNVRNSFLYGMSVINRLEDDVIKMSRERRIKFIY